MTVSLRAARINAGMTQQEVAERLGVSVPTLRNWERGKSFPDVRVFREMCELYNADFNDFNLGR